MPDAKTFNQSVNKINLARRTKKHLIKHSQKNLHTHLKHIQVSSKKQRQEAVPVNIVVIFYNTSYDICPLIVPELAIWYRFPQVYTLCYPITVNPIIKFYSTGSHVIYHAKKSPKNFMLLTG